MLNVVRDKISSGVNRGEVGKILINKMVCMYVYTYS